MHCRLLSKITIVVLLCISPTTLTAQSCTQEAHDRAGNDYQNIPYDNSTMFQAAQCCATCDADPKCAGWTFVWPPGPRVGCHLKFPVPPFGDWSPPCEPYCVSGHRPFPSGPFEVGFDRPGCDLASYSPVDGPEACAQACMMTNSKSSDSGDSGGNSTDKCQSWTFVKDRMTCYLKSCVPGETTDCPSCTSGNMEPKPNPCGKGHAVGQDRYGGDYKIFPSDGPDACCAACATDSNCVSWTYVNEGEAFGCHLKSNLPPRSNNSACVSSGAPLVCSLQNPKCFPQLFKPSQTCGAWIVWRYLKGSQTFIHQAFAYDDQYLSNNLSKPNLALNSGYYGCGYSATDPGVCTDCGSSSSSLLFSLREERNASSQLFSVPANSSSHFPSLSSSSLSSSASSSPFCMGLVCQDNADQTAQYNVITTTEGLSDIDPSELSYSCWLMDLSKAQHLDCVQLQLAETTVRKRWNYCENESAAPYSLQSHNCRYYVVEVMKQYCQSVGGSALGCSCM